MLRQQNLNITDSKITFNTTAIDSAGSNNGTINGATYSTDVPS